MSYLKKIGMFFLTVLRYPLDLLLWFMLGDLCVAGFVSIIAFPLGYYALLGFAALCADGFWQDPKTSLFLKPNTGDRWKENTYTEKIQHDILDEDGIKIGSVETDGATRTYYTYDERDYVANGYIIFYILFFPILKTLTIIMSFFALFTDKFYVSIKAPEDYNPIKYNRALHSLLNVVYERDEAEQKEVVENMEFKKRLKAQEELNATLRTQRREENKRLNEERRKERLEKSDNAVGVILKILLFLGIVVAIYFFIIKR